MSARQFGTIGMLAIGWVVAATVALHFLDPGLNPVNRSISEYALGPYWWLQKSSDFVLAIGIVAIALGLRQTLAAGRRVRLAIALLVIFGVSFFVNLIFDPDPIGAADRTAAGVIHGNTAMVGLISVLISAWLLRGVFSRDESWRGMSGAELWFAVAITLALIATMAAFATVAAPAVGPVGLAQRILVAVLLTWLGVLAWNVRTVRRVTGSAEPAPG